MTGPLLWPVVLDDGPLRLRPLRRRDRRAWEEVRARNEGWLRPWDPTVPPGAAVRPMGFGELVRSYSDAGRAGTGLPLVMEWRGENPASVIGHVSVSNIVGSSAQMAQIGYWIDQRCAGRGITPRAVALVADYCLFDRGLHRLEIVIRPENAASLRIVEKLGFREEGPRPAYLHIDGDWRDHRVFALNADEVPGGLLARCPALKLASDKAI